MSRDHYLFTFLGKSPESLACQGPVLSCLGENPAYPFLLTVSARPSLCSRLPLYNCLEMVLLAPG